MALVVKFGVGDMPYDDGDKTTGAVARILEEKYGPFAFFANEEIEQIFGEVASKIASGQPIPADMPESTALFQDYITEKKFDGKIPGVATKAAKAGISHRKKNVRGKKGKKNPERPSFQDTHLFKKSVVIELARKE